MALLQHTVDADPELATRLLLMAPVLSAGLHGIAPGFLQVAWRNITAHHFAVSATAILDMSSAQFNRVQREGALSEGSACQSHTFKPPPPPYLARLMVSPGRISQVYLVVICFMEAMNSSSQLLPLSSHRISHCSL